MAVQTGLLERTQPHLGTFVKISVRGTPVSVANKAIDRGFAAIAEIHRLMSFHEADSDLSRLNRYAAMQPVRVNTHTFNVIQKALEIAAASKGVFDITVAPKLVTWGFLPIPTTSPRPHERATWRDVELAAPNHISFRRPLWIDLGGIAKGYAVDLALSRMGLGLSVQCAINAGGDLRVAGPRPEPIVLRVPGHAARQLPVIEITEGSLASSSGQEHAKRYRQNRVGPHVHGVSRKTIGTRSFVSVVAEDCVVADALTKVVLALGSKAKRILKSYNAIAYYHTARDGWRTLGDST